MIKIYAAVINRPEFISLQAKTFKKFLVNEFEFTVLDDSIDPSLESEIKDVCTREEINYVRLPPELHQQARRGIFIGSYACAAGLQWTYDNLLRGTSDKVLWLDSDMFLYDTFDVEKYLDDCDLSGLPQRRKTIKYLWNGLLLFNMKTLPDATINFFPAIINHTETDVGGPLYSFFKEFPSVRLRPIQHTGWISNATETHLPSWHPTPYDPAYGMEILMDKFLHYGSGTNWRFHPDLTETYLTSTISEDPTAKKTRYLQQFLRAAIVRSGGDTQTPPWTDEVLAAGEFITHANKS